jgi:hypothetical protein
VIKPGLLLCSLLSVSAVEAKPRAITIGMAGTSPCAWTYEGRRFEDPEALVAALPKPRDSKAKIRIIGQSTTPYRCVGGLVFELQVAHYANFAVVALDDSAPR